MSRIIRDISHMVLGDGTPERSARKRTEQTMNTRNGERIVLAGGSGFLGGVLARHFSSLGFDVVVLSRDTTPTIEGSRTVFWDGRTPGEWGAVLNGCRAVVNLAGRSVNCRYHARNRAQMMDSRIEPTRAIGKTIARLRKPPEVWLNASTATIYKHSLDREMDEETGVIGATPEAKDAFSIEVATAWEKTFDECVVPQTRKVKLRSAMVLSAGDATNNVYRVLRRLTRFGLGGRMGSGRQFVSWIHEADFCRAVEWVIAHPEIDGNVNLAAPHPLPNSEMMEIVRRVTGRNFGLPATEWMLEVGAFLLRTETELIIKSRRVVPRRLMENGFEFRFNNFEQAARNLEATIAAA